ncbi:crAss001_48 related protein [Hafnia alvei]|uniref:crAss001_48 related protein n=1 Tax=Hafnia alvei TaxID=569 RepID=UPI00345E07AE
MTKLTTEITIEELQYRINAQENDLTQMWTADYFLSVQKELLALKQAAKNPAAWVATDSEDFPEYNSHNEFSADCGAGTPLYSAPVLPKQPIVLYMGRELISKEGLELIRDGVSEATKLEGACMASTILGGNHHAQPVSEPKAEGDVLSRLKAEHVELEDRYIKLANFIQVNPEFKKLAPRMQRLLENQTAAMVDYASILECRIDLIEDAAASAQEQK